MHKVFKTHVPSNHGLYILSVLAFAIMVIWLSLSQTVSGAMISPLVGVKPHSGANLTPSEVVAVTTGSERVKNDPYSQTFQISHYSELDSCHYPTDGGCLTASGKIAKVGMVATNLYPFGTRLLIDGKEYVVEDRISKTYNDRIDIWVGYGESAHQLALQLGVKELKVKVL